MHNHPLLPEGHQALTNGGEWGAKQSKSYFTTIPKLSVTETHRNTAAKGTGLEEGPDTC